MHANRNAPEGAELVVIPTEYAALIESSLRFMVRSAADDLSNSAEEYFDRRLAALNDRSEMLDKLRTNRTLPAFDAHRLGCDAALDLRERISDHIHAVSSGDLDLSMIATYCDLVEQLEKFAALYAPESVA